MSQSPRHLTFFVNANCNAGCHFCCYADEIAEGRPELISEEIRRVMLRAESIETIVLTGGEPFLRKDIREVFVAIANAPALTELSVSTNGSMPDRVADACAAFLDCTAELITLRVRVSIDAIGDAHDRIRRLPGLYEKVVTTVRQLMAMSRQFPQLLVSTTTVVGDFNVNDVVATARTLRSTLNPHFVEVLPVREGDRLPPKAFADIERIIYREFYAHPDVIARRAGQEAIALTELVAAELRHVSAAGRLTRPCAAGEAFVVMDPDGWVEPCEYLRDRAAFLLSNDLDRTHLRMGNVREHEYSLAKVVLALENHAVARTIAVCGCLVPCLVKMNVREWLLNGDNT